MRCPRRQVDRQLATESGKLVQKRTWRWRSARTKALSMTTCGAARAAANGAQAQGSQHTCIRAVSVLASSTANTRAAASCATHTRTHARTFVRSTRAAAAEAGGGTSTISRSCWAVSPDSTSSRSACSRHASRTMKEASRGATVCERARHSDTTRAPSLCTHAQPHTHVHMQHLPLWPARA